MDSRKGRVGGLLQKSVTKKSGPPDPTADPIHPDFSMDSRKDRPRTDPTADPIHPDFSMDSRKGRVGGLLQKSVMIDHDFCKKSGPPDPTADPIHPDFSMDSRKDRPRTDPTADPLRPECSKDHR